MDNKRKCSGARCPMQYNLKVKPSECPLYDKCECYTPESLSFNDQCKWLAAMIMFFIGDNPFKPEVNPKDVSMALKCCADDNGCDGCPYDKKHKVDGCKCYEQVKRDAAMLIDYIVMAEMAKDLNKEKENDG